MRCHADAASPIAGALILMKQASNAASMIASFAACAHDIPLETRRDPGDFPAFHQPRFPSSASLRPSWVRQSEPLRQAGDRCRIGDDAIKVGSLNLATGDQAVMTIPSLTQVNKEG